MDVDYSPFLTVLQDGSIWWQLTDAVKLGAGYSPIRDDHNGTTQLQANSNGIAADARTLLSEFSTNRLTAAHPRLVDRDGVRYVEAHEFLDWLSQYCAMQSGSTSKFPNELARAVRLASGRRARASPEPEFESLTLALEGHFETLLSDLPAALRQRVTEDFFPLPWDNLTPEQRCSASLQWDYQRDPRTESEREFWWTFYEREDDLKKQIEHWVGVQTPSARDLALKEARLAEIRQHLSRMDQQRKAARGDYYPAKPSAGAIKPVSLDDPNFAYLAYPKVRSRLNRSIGATPEEIAAWLFWGPKEGGIAAYMNVNELDPPPRFHFPVGTDSFDYLQYLTRCWFKKDDLAAFEPAERYITGKALLERWSTTLGSHAEAFVMAKIAESRLMECHPLYGLTRASCPENADFPPLESGLFAVSQIEGIESVDFDQEDDQSRAAQPKTAKPTARATGRPSNADKPIRRIQPSLSPQASRKRETEKRYKNWQAAYRKSKRSHPRMTDSWHAKQIAKLPIAEGRAAEYIRKQMKP